MDKGGNLVVVLFGSDNPETENQQVVNEFKKQLVGVDAKYNKAKIEIWRQNQLIGFCKPFPSLALQITQREKIPSQIHRSGMQDDEMRRHFKAGARQKGFIADLRQALRETG